MLWQALLTTHHVQCAQRHVREAVETLLVAQLRLEALHQHGALLLEDVDEVVQDLEMERRREDLAPRVPLLAGAGQQAGTEPWLQELVVVALLEREREMNSI